MGSKLMELFHAVMEILGSLSMMFVGISMCVWGPMIMKAIHRVGRRNEELWERHYEFEVTKANRMVEMTERAMRANEPQPEPKDVN